MQRDPILRVQVIGSHRVFHAGRCENMMLDKVFPCLAGHRFNQRAGDDVQDVVIGEGFAETSNGLQIAQRVHDVGTGAAGGRHDQQVAFAEAQSAAMGEQVADGHVLRGVRIVHWKPGSLSTTRSLHLSFP